MSEETEFPEESFLSHLVELRTRLVRSVVAVLVVFCCLFYWHEAIYNLLAAPLNAALPSQGRMQATGMVTGFSVQMEITFLVSLVLTWPFVLYQAWSFVAPGLYAHERHQVLPLVIVSTLLFLCGMVFCYFVFYMLFPMLASWVPKDVELRPDILEFWRLSFPMFIICGLVFEVPVVVVGLVKLGLVSVRKLTEFRRYVIVGAVVLGAFTPGDVLAQLLAAVPIWLLFELGLLVSRWVEKKTEDEEEEDPVAG